MFITSSSRIFHRGIRRSARPRGNAVLDLALVLPLLLSLTFGAVEYGQAMFIKHALQAAAQDGARAAIVPGADAAAVQDAVDSSMQAAGFSQDKYARPATIEMYHNGGYSSGFASAVPGDGIRVTVQAQWSAIGLDVLPTWLGGISDSKTLTAAAQMRKEG